MDIINLRELLEASWSINSTFTPGHWNTGNRALGNCGVSALITQDYFPWATLMEGYIDEEGRIRHFWCRLNAVDIDFTWRQFPEGTKLYYMKEIDRKDILWNEWFEERYEHLKQKVRELSIRRQD